MTSPDDYQSTPEPIVHNPLAVMQPGEQVICEIKRHPIGLIGAYIAVGLALVAIATVVFTVIPDLLTAASNSQSLTICWLIIAAATLISAGFLTILSKIYWGNRWIVTSDSITQIAQTHLFSKQTSQLSLANIEDVTATQNGLLTTLFNYGTLKAETAGQSKNFIFLYCPKPTYYAQQILSAREHFDQSHHHAQPSQPSSNQTAAI